MTDREYLEKLVALSEHLNKMVNSNLYDQVAYKSILEEMEKLHTSGYRRRRRPDWLFLCFIIFLLVILCFIVLAVVC